MPEASAPRRPGDPTDQHPFGLARRSRALGSRALLCVLLLLSIHLFPYYPPTFCRSMSPLPRSSKPLPSTHAVLFFGGGPLRCRTLVPKCREKPHLPLLSKQKSLK